MKHRVPYCPHNGCGMPNGTAMNYDMDCKTCGAKLVHSIKVCPNCRHCTSCGRIAKRHYELPTTLKGRGFLLQPRMPL